MTYLGITYNTKEGTRKVEEKLGSVIKTIFLIG